MPDWISHILFGLILAELLSVKKKSLIVLGAVLPDIFSKITHLQTFFPNLSSDIIYRLVFPFHTVIGGILLAIVITPLFRYPWKKTAFLISLGVLTHLLADSTVKVFTSNYQGSFLFPFSWHGYGLNIVRTENFFVVIISFFIVWILIKLVKTYTLHQNKA
ncbi:MAG: metal-dependent hydrolase [Nanoarchaeota archaeon]